MGAEDNSEKDNGKKGRMETWNQEKALEMERGET